MTAIAGYLDHGGPVPPEEATRGIIAALTSFGLDRQRVRRFGDVSFGNALKCTLPEDDYDTQPSLCQGGRSLLTADVRIDNRDEISERLGIGSDRARTMADSDLLCAAWDKWQLACVDHLLGDLAFAVWDGQERSLTLVRGPLSTRPLFYCRMPQFTAFASMPSALFAIPALRREIDLDELAAVAGGVAQSSPATLFKHIRRVAPGTAVTLSCAGEQTRRIWELRTLAAPATLAEAGEGLRAELDRSVRAQLRRRSGPVATQLSSGRDSSAVTTAVARALAGSGERMIALTGAPREGFADGIDRGWLSDESVIAAITAAAFPQIEHAVCRTSPVNAPALFDRVHGFHFGPMMNAYSGPWWSHTISAAAEHGARILLIGQLGNYSISRGGFDALDDLRASAGFLAWLRVARSLTQHTGLRWRGVAYLSAAPLMSPRLHRVALRLAGRHDPSTLALPLLRGDLRQVAERLGYSRLNEQRIIGSYHDNVERLIHRSDNADKFGLAAYGVDVRDPTADRRLVEYCHALSPAQLVSVSSSRPAYEAAFADRVPRQVIEGKRRGFQAADWFEVFRPASLRRALHAYAANPLVAEMFDFSAMERLIDSWPNSGGYEAENIAKYGQGMLNTLSLAGFIAAQFPD